MSDEDAAGAQRQAAFDEQVKSVLLASRVLVALSARSIAVVEDVVSLTQLRVLVVLDSRGPMSLSALAVALDMHPSSTSRACDKLVTNALISRRHSRLDRRNVSLDVTAMGRKLVESVVSRRRAATEAILQRMPLRQRSPMALAMRQFAVAGGELVTDELSSPDWVAPRHARPPGSPRRSKRSN